MKCPRCGNMVNPTVAQCPHCGQPLRAAAPVATNVANATLATAALQNSYDKQRKRTIAVAVVAGAIALLCAVIMGFRNAGALGANGENPKGPLLTANGSLPGNVMVAKGETGPAVFEKVDKAQVAPQMPQDVYDWLEHLRKCEAKKVEIAGDQLAEMAVYGEKLKVLGAATGLMDPYDQSSDSPKDESPDTYSKGKIMDLRPAWTDLITFFHSKKPPEECIPIADDFDRAINEIPGAMGDVGDVLNMVQSDPGAAMKAAEKMQNGSYGDIDRYFDRCDQKLTQICVKYSVNKWFNIKGDIGSGGVLGKLGASLPGGSQIGLGQ